ncbi:DUF742 domain-containing protein [Nocardia sp. NPDC006982]|uniref:DUF742 domain-containing protein n=2 Tax=unclassified Nocardia TaxID=2637762 RepID=UPI0036B8C250
MSRPHGSWFDEAAGPLVRPFAMTRGRTRGARSDLDMLTQVLTVRSGEELGRMEPEYGEIARLCEYPQSIAEVSARLRLPLAVTKILVGDLVIEGYLVFRSSVPETSSDDIDILRAVLNGIRRL